MYKSILLILSLCFIVQFSFSQENTATTCSDGIDNDGDGFIDCEDSGCKSLPNNGCNICGTGISFADSLIDYKSGCTVSDPFPSGSLGVADYYGYSSGDQKEFTFLGDDGYITLGFVNNILTNSGDSKQDLWVFEVGQAIESVRIFLKPYNNYTRDYLIQKGLSEDVSTGFFYIALIGGSTSGLDIDSYIQNASGGTLKFKEIKIEDYHDDPCGTQKTPGADIDAVCALSTIAAEICNNGIDDDGNGLVDCDDPALSDQCCCLDTPLLEDYDLFLICSGQEIEISYNPLFQEVLWQDSFIGNNRILNTEGTYFVVAKDSCQNVFVDTFTIQFLEIITSLDTLQLCQGDTLHIFGQDVTQEGTYNQTFTASNGCDSTQYFVVEYYEESQVQEFDFSMCQGDSLSFLNVWITDFGDFSIIDSSGNCLLEYLLHIDENPSYEIFFQESICKGEVLVWQGMEINDEGQYFANLSTSSGCDSILSLTLKHFPEVSYQVNINASCADSDTGNVTVSPEGNNLAWAELNGVPSDNFSFQNLNAGTYVLSVIDINGCRSDSMIIVDNYQFNEVDLEVLDNICADDSVGSIASQNPEYLISTNLDSIFSNEIMNLLSGNYTIYIKTSEGCLFDTSVMVMSIDSVSVMLPPDVTIDYGDSYQIIPTITGNITNFTWSPVSGLDCGDCPTPLATPDQSTQYLLTVTSEMGCVTSDYFNIFITPSVIFPNIFSPNSDGNNDIFFLNSSGDILIVEMKIFDRWGDLVFNNENFLSNDSTQGWDGTFNGKKVESGVYSGFVKYLLGPNSEFQILKFDVTVIK
ncbi:MAG TPA: gliding motility-associated C-terminal domain-containing protein [Saprospiraceae bacterium]|nr:gliding motility-associated C-terminal domain-containing protein [Saprospiraceae bacterium]